MTLPLLKSLNEVQAQAVRWTEGPELVLAGAGSGKTRVLTAKIAYLISECGVAPWRVLALTFTNKAAHEMQERVKAAVGENLHGMQVSTFHSWGLRFLYRNSAALQQMGYPPSFVIFDRGDTKSLVKKLARELSIDSKQHDTSELIDIISRSKTGCDPLTLEPEADERWYELCRRYNREMLRQGALDFDDLMILPLYLLMNNQDILTREREYAEWILVDEYQDVNTPQYLLLKLLAGDSGNIMVVGDPDQSIYGWRGADMSLILGFEQDFPGARIFVLDENYRSTANILNSANRVIRNNADRYEKNLWTSRGDGARVRLLLARNDQEEADFVADEIERLRREGHEYGEMTLLYRMNALSRGFEQKLLERGIPYRVIRGLAFYDRREVKDTVAMLRLAVNPKDSVSAERIANVPVRGLGKKGAGDLVQFLADAAGEPRDIWSKLKYAPPFKGKAGQGTAKLAEVMIGILEAPDMESAINHILYNCSYEDYLKSEFPEDWTERVDNVLELLSVMPKEGGIAELLAQIALYTDHDIEDSGSSQVNLLTMHAAKGLEFPVVFIVGFEEGIFPSGRCSDNPSELEEERRLCYVGMTRAKERLYLSGAMSRLMFGSFRKAPFSRFIGELPGECLEIDDRSKRGELHVRNGPVRRRWVW